jgi:hypothetical protein
VGEGCTNGVVITLHCSPVQPRLIAAASPGVEAGEGCTNGVVIILHCSPVQPRLIAAP